MRWRPSVSFGRLTLVLLLGFGADPAFGQEPTDGVVPQRRARDVHLFIQTSRMTYRIGDTIRVRVSLVNTSDERILFFPIGIQYDAELIVSDENGQVIAPVGQKALPGSTSGMPAMLLPRDTTPWWIRNEWSYLSEWGYRLLNPGRYTIRGLPRLGYPGLERDDTTVRSNTVVLRLLPN